VLALVEFSDVVFALDSIPAIFAITRDPFLVYTSNVFAILGLRALFFALAGVIHRFHYLKYGLSIVLVLVGGKMVVNAALGPVIPTQWALLLTAGVIGGSVLLSVLRTRGARPDDPNAALPRGWVPGSPPKEPGPGGRDT
jgi:tellurite resistance protein TerC